METLQKAVARAAQLYEESWDETTQKYAVDLREAADKAAQEVGYDKRGTEPIFLLLFYCWNDALCWAGVNT